MTSSKRYFWSSAAGVALLAVIVVMINILARWVPLRMDLTQGQLYSLSKSSRQLVKTLDERVLIKAYFSQDLPPPYNTFERYTRDVLSEYERASGGRIRYEFVLPFPAIDFERRAEQANLAPVQFEHQGGDQLTIRRAFMGLVLFHRDRSETLPLIKNPQTLEYEITSRLAKMVDRPKKTIALTRGHGELPWQVHASPLAHELASLFNFTEVTLPAGATVPLQADAVLVMGPRLPFDATSLSALDRWTQNGTPLGLFLDAKTFMPGTFGLAPLETGFKPFLAARGVDWTGRLVIDAQSEAVAISQNVAGLSLTSNVRYPFVPLVSDVAKDHPVTRGLSAVGMPFAVRLERSSAPPTGVSYTPLLRSSARSWLAPEDVFAASPDKIPAPIPGQPLGPFVLGVAVEGKGAGSSERLVILGSSYILNPQMPEFTGTGALMMNVLAYLSHDDTLAGIRAKVDMWRPLKPLRPASRELVKISLVLGVPLLAALWGVWRWQRRRAWRTRASEQYKKS